MTEEERAEFEELKKFPIDELPKEKQERLLHLLYISVPVEERLKNAAQSMTERQFINSLVYFNEWTIEEKFEFYHKHCKKD